MKNKKVVISGLLILLWGFIFDKIDLTGRVIRDSGTKIGVAFFPTLSLIFLLLTLLFIYYYLREEWIHI